jgi:hypothetical protein
LKRNTLATLLKRGAAAAPSREAKKAEILQPGKLSENKAIKKAAMIFSAEKKFMNIRGGEIFPRFLTVFRR